MSVRNQYARNYYKIAPMPPSSMQIVNARNAARRRNMYRAGYGEDVNNNSDKGEISEARHESDFTNITPTHDPADIFTARNGEKLKKGSSEVTIYGKRELNKLISHKVTSKSKVPYPQATSRANKAQEIDTKDNNKQQRTSSITTSNAQARPKSARPESRWERRVDDEHGSFSDGESENKVSPERPKSARPDSRMIRMLDSEAVVDCSSRPRTSHGRRESSNDKVDQTEQKTKGNKTKSERPKSRRDNYLEKNRRSFDESAVTQSKADKISKHRQSVSRNSETDYVVHDVDYHIGISTFYPEAKDRIHGIDDINVQIEDMDRDVDPVLFFMQDNANSSTVNDTKIPSLSKDAINCITNEKNSRQTKQEISSQGNNQNQRHFSPETNERYHRNRCLSLQNSTGDGNQRYVDTTRHDRIKSDSLISTTVHAPEISNKSRTNSTSGTMLASSRVLKIRDTGIGKQYSNYEGVTDSSQRRQVVMNRKPRKLKPLTPSCLEE